MRPSIGRPVGLGWPVGLTLMGMPDFSLKVAALV